MVDSINNPVHKCGGRTDGYGGFTCVICHKHHPKFEQHTAKRIWTKWIQPIMKGYLFKCCDCGLVHEMQFRALKRGGKLTKQSTWPAEGLDTARYRVEFRVKRRDDI